MFGNILVLTKTSRSSPIPCLNSMLADKLNMSPEEAERWIVNLIRNARLDAKIDSKLVRLSVFVFPAQLMNQIFLTRPLQIWRPN